MTLAQDVDSEIDKYITKGESICVDMLVEIDADTHSVSIKDDIRTEYQEWYSIVLQLIQKLAPYRAKEFEDLYVSKPKTDRVAASFTYGLQDWVLARGEPTSYTITHMKAQCDILKSLKSTQEAAVLLMLKGAKLDLIYAEIDQARILHKREIFRCAIVVAGVALESHLIDVCKAHKLTVPSRATINKLTDQLTKNKIIDTHVVHELNVLHNIRNNASHKRDVITAEDSQSMIEGTERVIRDVST